MPILEDLRKNKEALHRTFLRLSSAKEVSLMPLELAFLSRVVD
jgi:hypothetical protein